MCVLSYIIVGAKTFKREFYTFCTFRVASGPIISTLEVVQVLILS